MDPSLLDTENETVQDDNLEIAAAAKEIIKLLKSRGVDAAYCTKALAKDGTLLSSSDNL